MIHLSDWLFDEIPELFNFEFKEYLISHRG